MRREIVTLNNSTQARKVAGININTTLKDFREQLKAKEYTEIKTIYRAGHHIVEFITATLTQDELRAAGLIK